MLNYVKLFKSCTTTLFRNFAEITQTKKSQRLNLIELFGVFFFSAKSFEQLLLIWSVTPRVTTWVHSKSKSLAGSLKARTKLYIQAFLSAGRHILPLWWWPHEECDTDVCLPRTTLPDLSRWRWPLQMVWEPLIEELCPNRPKGLRSGEQSGSHLALIKSAS